MKEPVIASAPFTLGALVQATPNFDTVPHHHIGVGLVARNYNYHTLSPVSRRCTP